MLLNIDHIVITATDVDACLNFYKKLGFSVDIDGRYQLFSGDFKINVHALGHELLPKARNVQPGSADFCMATDEDLHELKLRLEQAGLKIELGIVPRSGARGEMGSIYLRDPDQNLVEICSYE